MLILIVLTQKMRPTTWPTKRHNCVQPLRCSRSREAGKPEASTAENALKAWNLCLLYAHLAASKWIKMFSALQAACSINPELAASQPLLTALERFDERGIVLLRGLDVPHGKQEAHKLEGQ